MDELTKIDREIEALKRRREMLRTEFAREMRHRMVVSPHAASLTRQIEQLTADIEQLLTERKDVVNMRDMNYEECLQIMMIPLIADVMNDMIAAVNGNLRRHGVCPTKFGELGSEIKRLSLLILDTLGGLPPSFSDTDTLIDAIEKKCMTYLKQRYKQEYGVPTN